MDRIPQAIAAALLAGVLARFGLDALLARAQPRRWLVLAMPRPTCSGRRLWPRYAVPGVLLAGIGVAARAGPLALGAVRLGLGRAGVDHAAFSLAAWSAWRCRCSSSRWPRRTCPAWRRSAPRATPRRCRRSITATGLATLLLAPFGGYALNLAAITAAICMGREAHDDPARRYVAAVPAGVFYIAARAGRAARWSALLAAFPRELVLAVAGPRAAGHHRRRRWPPR